MSETTPDESGHLTFGDDKIWYERFGQGDKETVCLLNGLAMHTKAWYWFVPALTDDYDVVLYDYLGQGQSSCPDRPHFIPDFCRYLTGIIDHIEIDKLHVMGISYGGFVGLDYGRLYQDRLHTLTLSGILLSHERQFEMYQDLSLRFYRAGPVAFELYTHYLYEKIFGEAFLRALPPENLEEMRLRFYERYKNRVYSLVRLTEAQNPFFDGLEERLTEYQAVRTPVLLVAGEQDRVLPLWQQKKLLDVFPDIRFELIEDAGHVVYLERKDDFFPLFKAFIKAKSTDFERPRP
ncbi:MAG: alpha/beta hydrolase [Acidobacteriota bacterium]|nr:alpha/beta hydrolase [Acidobacteriota bacterium]